MSCFVNFLKKYSPFILAVMVGLIIVFPSIYFRYFDSGFRGIELAGADGEDLYVSEVREIYDGHYLLGNVFLADQKDAPFLQQPLAPMIMSVLGKILFLSAPQVNVFTKFLLPMLLTLIIYPLFFKLVKRKDWALFMTAFIMFSTASLQFLNPESWRGLLKGNFFQSDYIFLSYSRSINPQISSFFFYGYLLLIWQFLFGDAKKVYGIVAAIVLGLSFYVYFFTFSFLFALNGVLFLYFFFSKKMPELKKVIFILLGALLIGIPYFINVNQAIKSPFYNETVHRLGALETHQFIFSRIWWGAFLAVLLLYRRIKLVKIFLLAFLGAAFLVTNQQIFTGHMAPIPSHYHWYYIAPIGGAILFYILLVYLEKFLGFRFTRILTIILFSLFLLSAISLQYQSYLKHRDGSLEAQKYSEAFRFLDKNDNKDKSVFTNTTASRLIPMYTGLNVYHSTGVGDSLVDAARLRNAYYIYAYLNGVSATSASAYFFKNRDDLGAWFFSQTYRVKNGCYGCFSDDILIKAIREYQNFLDGDFFTELKRYPLDFILWDRKADPKWPIDKFFKNKIYDKNDIMIYQVF